MKYLRKTSDENKYKLEYSNTLDISYGYDKNNYSTYRISIESLDKINMLMSSLNSRKNHIIFNILASQILNENDSKLSIINKIKDFNNTYNIDDWQRITSPEELVEKSILLREQSFFENKLEEFRANYSKVLLSQEEYFELFSNNLHLRVDKP